MNINKLCILTVDDLWLHVRFFWKFIFGEVLWVVGFSRWFFMPKVYCLASIFDWCPLTNLTKSSVILKLWSKNLLNWPFFSNLIRNKKIIGQKIWNLTHLMICKIKHKLKIIPKRIPRKLRGSIRKNQKSN